MVTNNSDSVQLTAMVKDPSNHPVAGITVNFTMPQDVAANFTLENNGIAITQANGEAHVTLKGKKAGTHTVTATLGNNNTSDSQPVTFVADKASAQVVLQISKDEITGNGVDSATLTATVKDQFDNEVNNLPVTFSSASSGLTLTPGVSNTNESGIAQATLAGVAFGEKTVTASLANNGASDNKTVHFIGDTAAAKIIELTPVPDSIIAGTPQNSSGSVITATVVDNNGFPVKGVTVNFTSNAATAEMTNGGQAVTNEQGKATVTYTNTRSSIESGARPDTVEASLENGSSTLSTSINVNADASTAHLTLLQALFDTVSAGETTSLYIEVKNNYGNGVPQQEVTLSVSPSEGVTPSNNAIYTTNHDGNFYASFTATKAGVYQLTATLENGDSMQQTVTYVPNVANAEITLAASKDPVIADNNDLTTLTATVADTEGNAIANTEVTFTLPEDLKANFTLSDGGKAVTDTEGKAKVTLKGTKAGAHTVTASMAGGKSEQLVVNFIADTLTAQVNLNVTEDNFIANNVGMTRLQATVTDGNGNPLANEAVTFTLPADVSASFTLGQGGSAITDINGKAEVTLSGTKSGSYPVTVSVNNYGVSDTKQVTLIADAGTAKLASLTSVYSFVVSTTEGATMTASVTVSAVTTAGGMQTVDITLVAGPADASQSVLKNNRSSLKGDFTDSAELHLVLHDISGNPIKVSEGMEFVQSGTNVPYMKISAIDYSQNINGDYKATITGGGEGIATLIPVLNGVHQAGLSTTIQFTRAEDKIMSGTVSVNGTDLPTTTFPSQGFTGAYYQLNNDNFAPGKTAADYEFSSSASWVDVDAIGKVTFKNVGSNWERITATPKSGGPSYVYEIRVKSWWVNSGDAFMIYSLAENFCSSNGYTLPRADHLNHSRSRGIGSLYSEWGDMGHYTTEAGFRSNMYWSSSPANSSEQYVVSLATGDQSVFEKLGFAYATCYKNL
ncbi:Ig-like domain-containing protein [Escherichia coli]|uniref:Ig-like domain-containing protein n=1 Tax=Escherichia coli TaxID=562 RepID=UPI003D9BBB57